MNMFHNVLITPLRNTEEKFVTDIHYVDAFFYYLSLGIRLIFNWITEFRVNLIIGWENHPFTTIWPEENHSAKLVYPSKNQSERVTKAPKRKRHRTAYTTSQLQFLEKSYNQCRYISRETRKEIAECLQITEKSIKVWFQNRRMKEKKESSESSDSSAEVTSSEIASPLRNMMPTSPVQNVKVSSVEANQVYNSDNNVDKSLQYQFPTFHFNIPPEYQNTTKPVMPPGTFNSDFSTYPTYYYPTAQDYYYGANINNSMNPGMQWSASNFDLNYFQ